MKKNKRLKFILLTVVLLLIAFFGVKRMVLPFFLDDPFFYCKIAGTADVPDSVYQGTQNPEVIIRKLRKILNISDEVPADTLKV